MDFDKVLHKAQKNEKKKAKERVNCYRTTFSPPRKEGKTKGLSANIQKFLARREEDERRKKIEELKKKEELLALRNQDNKAKKRVQVMLKRTKSANKSVLDDAIDTVNTADTLNGPQQCDEDDYGYVSQEASKFYKQMMEKYSSVPVEEKKVSKPNNRATAKDLVNTKDRVRQALLRQEEEEHMPHKRKRKHKDKGDDDDDDRDEYIDHRSRSNSPEKIGEHEKPKPKRPPMPPPMDFSSLLEIAAKKQHEPVVIEKKIIKKEKVEPERLMTKKEKMEYEKQKERERKVLDYSKQSSSNAKSDSPNSANCSREFNSNRMREAGKPDKDKVRQKESEKHSEIKNKDKERMREKDKGASNSLLDGKRVGESCRSSEKNLFSNGKGSYSKSSPQLCNSVSPHSRSRSPYASRDQAPSNGQTSYKEKLCDMSPSLTKNKDDNRRSSLQPHEVKALSLPRIPKIPKIREGETRVEAKYIDKDRVKEREKLKDREKEKERDRHKEREKERDREKAKEKERDKAKEREREREKEREKERQRLREKEKQLEREREKLLEMQRELEREREKTRERMKEKESQKDWDRRERDSRDSVLKKPFSVAEKEKMKQTENKKSMKYDKLDLFGDRDSASPETVSSHNKTSDDKRNIKTERIKLVEDTTRDLFDNPVTIARKQSQSDRNKERERSNALKQSSSNLDEKVKPSSSKPTVPVKNLSDKDKARVLNLNDRKREADEARCPPDKRPRLDGSSFNKPQATKDSFKKPLPPSRSGPPKQFPPRDLKPKEFPPRDLQPKQFPPRDLQPKQFPPRDLQQKRFPPSDLKSRKFPPNDVRRGIVPRKRFEYERSDSEDSDEDDEEEYASDLDDFIDDGPAEDEEDYSKYIKDIFGYDKSKYRDDDEDIAESSFAEQMREECRSARLGLQEDLEDMAMEQREKRRKTLMRMKQGRR